MILHRCFAWSERAGAKREGGALWFPRAFQGDGRHDNPAAYGCLYLTDREVSGVVEQLAPWRRNHDPRFARSQPRCGWGAGAGRRPRYHPPRVTHRGPVLAIVK